MSKFGLGLDNMLRSYLIDEVSNLEMEDAFVKHTNWDVRKGKPYVLFRKTRKIIESDKIHKGITATAGGFTSRAHFALKYSDESLNSKMDNFKFEENRITNLEMETAANIWSFDSLGHNALSLNAIIANRFGNFQR
jgi:uridine phosphorylase